MENSFRSDERHWSRPASARDQGPDPASGDYSRTLLRQAWNGPSEAFDRTLGNSPSLELERIDAPQAGEAVGRERLKGGYFTELDRIEPDPEQPRKRIERDYLAELTQSVRELGVLQPITVRYVAAVRRYQRVVSFGRLHPALYAAPAADVLYLFGSVPLIAAGAGSPPNVQPVSWSRLEELAREHRVECKLGIPTTDLKQYGTATMEDYVAAFETVLTPPPPSPSPDITAPPPAASSDGTRFDAAVSAAPTGRLTESLTSSSAPA